MFDSLISKIAIFTVIVVTIFVAFFNLNINGENAICHEAGYGDFDDSTGTCTVTGPYADNLIVVTGNTANSPRPAIEDKESATYNYLKNSVAKNASIKTISVAPSLDTEKINIKNNETNDASGFVESIDNTIGIINQTTTKSPASDGATYFEAITKAGRESSSYMSNSQEENDSNNDGAAIIVVGSGLSDSGVLNFADYDLLLKDANDVIEAMSQTGQLSNSIENAKIIWLGLGQTTSPQDELNEADKDNLRRIYKEIFTKKGAKEVIFDDTTRTSSSIEDNDHQVKPSKTSSCNIIYNISHSELFFDGDSAELTDEEKAKNALSNVLSSAKACPSRRIVVTGYMASGNCTNKPNNPNLAKNRANTIKQFLSKNGANNEIEAIDGGVFDPSKSECDNGQWQPSLAEDKRKVTIEFK